jgi:hypothetical protein
VGAKLPRLRAIDGEELPKRNWIDCPHRESDPAYWKPHQAKRQAVRLA